MRGDFEISPLTPRLGAEIDGLDVARLDDESFNRLYREWLRYKVLFLRGQSLELDGLLRFSRRFGDLMRLPYIEPLAGYPDIIRVLKQADETGMGVFGGDWHSDFSFLEAPPSVSVLYAEQVPPVGGDTLWIDMEKALQTLPRDLRGAIEGRNGIHSGTPYGVAHAPAEETRFRGSIRIERNNPEADRETLHPLICRHPDSGNETLFANPTYTIGIEGYPHGESEILLAHIFRHAARPEFSCRFRWSEGCIALWDNRNTLHYAVNDYDGFRRCLYRATVRGEPPRAA